MSHSVVDATYALLLFSHRVFPHGRSWPRTSYVFQTGLKLKIHLTQSPCTETAGMYYLQG